MASLFDMDVLIDYLRGLPDAVTAVESRIVGVCLSAMTVAEIYQSVREAEQAKVARTSSSFTVAPSLGRSQKWAACCGATTNPKARAWPTASSPPQP